MQLRLKSDQVEELAAYIREWASTTQRPFVVSIDGRSGSGKSTLGSRLGALLHASVIEGDDFFAGGIAVRADGPADRVRDCIDMKRLGDALRHLRNDQPTFYHAFDWDKFDGSLRTVTSVAEPAHIVIVEGAFTSQPALANLLDMRILLRVPDPVRLTRLEEREETLGPWELQWHEAEEYYFYNLAKPSMFDVIIDDDGES